MVCLPVFAMGKFKKAIPQSLPSICHEHLKYMLKSRSHRLVMHRKSACRESTCGDSTRRSFRVDIVLG